MKFFDKTLRLLFCYQNNIGTGNFGNNATDDVFLKTAAHDCSENIDNQLKERLISFYIDGNPVNLLCRDELFHEAALFVVLTQSCSIISLRREFSLEFKRAKQIMDQLASTGIISPYYSNESSRVLIQDEYSLKRLLTDLPEIDINGDVDLLDSFYENNKDEIEFRKAGVENERLEELKKTKLEAFKLLLAGKALKKRLPDHEYREIIQMGDE